MANVTQAQSRVFQIKKCIQRRVRPTLVAPLRARLMHTILMEMLQMMRPKSSQLLFSISGKNPIYEDLRLDPESSNIRDKIEEMWEEYQTYADTDFLQKARDDDFQSRHWELYLGCSLIRRGNQIEPRLNRRHLMPLPNIGPDFKITAPNPAWIEAVAPGPGTLEDAVPEAQLCVANKVPDDEMKLRLLQAIRDKAKKRLCYIQKGVVDRADCYVVAVNTSKIRHVPDLDPPRIVRAVLAFGSLEVSVDRVSGAFSGWRFQSQSQIIRRTSGNKVSTRVFLDSQCAGDPDYAGYEGISAVLSSNMGPFNACEPWFDHTRFVIGNDYCLVHNPLAANPLPLGFLKVGREYWVGDGEVLKNKVWSEERAQRHTTT